MIATTGKVDTSKVLKGLRASGARTTKNLKEAKRRIGLMVQRRARDYAPKLFGGLERSIDWKDRGKDVLILVAGNSEAGAYARRMHDKRYNRGRGTVLKGPKAGRKYITRAIHDEEPNIRKALMDSASFRKTWRPLA